MENGLQSGVQALGASQKRMECIAANLANLQAPGYKRLNSFTHVVETVRRGEHLRAIETESDVDFSQGLVGLLGNPRTIGEVFNITGEDVYTWDQIYTIVGEALGVSPRLVHVASELFPVVAPEWFWSGEMLGDIGHSGVRGQEPPPRAERRSRRRRRSSRRRDRRCRAGRPRRSGRCRRLPASRRRPPCRRRRCSPRTA